MMFSLALLSVNRDASLALRSFKSDEPFDEGKDGVVSAHANVRTRVELGSALSNDDGSRLNEFSAESLDP
jgi:hypothetical protein